MPGQADNHQNGSNDNNGPAALLALDPATLAIRASSDAETLQKLNAFALDLQHYVGLVQSQQQQQQQLHQEQQVAVSVTTTGSADNSENENDDATKAECNVAPNDAPEDKPAASNNLGKGQKSDGEITVDGMARNDIVKREEEDDDGNDVNKDVPEHAAKKESCQDDSTDTPAWTPSCHPPAPKRVKREPQHSTTTSIQDYRLRRPRRYEICKGSLEQSSLVHSVGRTRQVLNAHLAKLGLTAKFSNGVLSKRGTKVSHLTLQTKWNDMPQNRFETLEWWLGQGAKRLELASVLDPSKYQQSSVPVFWAEPRPDGGAALCHYVGHFKCIGFNSNLRLTFKDEPRQALIEFRFCRFDAELSETIAGL